MATKDSLFRWKTDIQNFLGDTKPPLWIRRSPCEYWDGSRWISSREARSASVEAEPAVPQNNSEPMNLT